jgi:hypothetical protein
MADTTTTNRVRQWLWRLELVGTIVALAVAAIYLAR